MTQLDDLQAYTNFELPRRRVLLKAGSETVYDGDPNDSSAPNELKLAPAGTWSLRVTPSRVYYTKMNSGATDWVVVVGSDGYTGATALHTEEALTFPIDYNDGYAVDPPVGTRFSKQSEIDDYLTSQGATAFKYLDRAYRSTPTYIDHHVTLALAAGIHRPSGDPENNPFGSWQLKDSDWFIPLGYGVPGTGRNLGASGAIEISGPAIDEYLSVVGSLSIDSFVADSGNPSISFTGTPFDGYNLRGRYAILDTGTAYLIHDHTSSVIYVNDAIVGTPTTCWVGRPSAILRNSLDDASNLNTGSLSIAGNGALGLIYLNDFAVENFGGNAVVVYLGGAKQIRSTRLVVDDLSPYDEFAKAPNGRAFQYDTNQVGSIYFVSCAYVAPVPLVAGGDLVAYFNMAGTSLSLYITSCYFAPNKGFALEGCKLRMGKTVFEGQILYGLYLKDCTVDFYDLGGKKNEIRNSEVGLVLDGSQSKSFASSYNNIEIMITGNTGPGVTVTGGSKVKLGAFVDGGGNLDVGIDLTGHMSSVEISSAVDLTGALGDVRFSNGSIVSYSDIVTADGIRDANGNIVRVL